VNLAFASVVTAKAMGMKQPEISLLIRAKLTDGRLPHNSIPRIWGGPGNNESCDACEETISKQDFVMEGISLCGVGVQFHVQCFYLWDSLRTVPGRDETTTPR
jgi:hypothetical protein